MQCYRHGCLGIVELYQPIVLLRRFLMSLGKIGGGIVSLEAASLCCSSKFCNSPECSATDLETSIKVADEYSLTCLGTSTLMAR